MRHAAFATIAAVLAAPAGADTADGAALLAQDWEAVVDQARGGEVNFYLWGGAETSNGYVDWIGERLAADYDITLNRVPLTDTTEAVNIVLAEQQAGQDESGAVDLVWINGENFRTLRQGDLLWCGYTEALPNGAYVDWEAPAIANDFGVPIEGCEVPWSRVQFAFAHDSARTPQPPRSIPALIDWVEANPGRFTYPAPPDFTGEAFVRHVFYHAAGGPEALMGPFDQEVFDEVAPKAWEILNAMEPDLWREGATYPTSITQLQGMVANSEVDLYFTYDPAEVGAAAANGTFPETMRSYGLTGGTLANTNYVAVPYNSPHKAAALVTLNMLLSPEAQLEKAQPQVWGAAPAIEVERLEPAMQEAFAETPRPAQVVAPEDQGPQLPELQPAWIEAIAEGWIDNVGTR
ncbi:ABC transporter substrate-binding protein [Pseudoroseicyclus aestuarii]|uniref:Putative spermidine/putrescine transport system substrate-binding protein n=1 Tax=Pseudoroseicyclus aestuarii TaxID=1795041 RepID=A0A318SMT5_9RHOB|nr:ABC transporter substrate-binding protein [Pseudoroseicyclus aestuarii]PYE81401.1 putative spermidine/putrescine transport system substrate-binding protein [Pseudoroseicyclus aestuarii]